MDKRAREAEKARKKREKADRRADRRDRGPGEIEIVSASDMTGDLPTISEALQQMERGGGESRSAATIPCRLFVGGLSWNLSSGDLREVFEEVGEVVDCVVMTDRATGRSRGFGFVTMADRKIAQKVIDELNGAEVDGRRIVVNIATER
jgi:RNA recognition motif-containing protein